MAHGRFDNPVIAALHGILDLFRKQELRDRLTENDRLDGKMVAITGANSGLGYALTVEVAKRGAKVIMACRRDLPQVLAKAKIDSGSDQIEMAYLDLSKTESIHGFVAGLKEAGTPVDVLVLNAGVALPGARKTESGQEEMFFVNYFANFMLVNLALKEGVVPADRSDSAPRILFISSDSHQGSSAIDYSEFGRYFDYGVSKGIGYYSYYKLVLNTFAVELSRRLNKERHRVGVHVICPGPVNSEITKEAPPLLHKVLKSIFRLFFKSPKEAALPVVYLAASKDLEGKSGEYMHMFKSKRMDEKCYDPEEGAKLWDASIELWARLDSRAITAQR